MSIRAKIGKNIKKITDGLVQLIDQYFFVTDIQKIQKDVVYSRDLIKNQLGINNISEKKMSEESNRNIVKKGLKMTFPMGLARDKGNPQ